MQQAKQFRLHIQCVVTAAVCFILPLSVNAQVRINEIAWMGDDRSHTNEWIELYNTHDTAVQVDGWTLRTQDGSISTTLEGTLPAGGYFLLERTDDTAVRNKAADQVYVGSLSNDGTTVELLNAADETVDVVAGGDGWGQVGGSNETKDTAQYNSDGWVTAVPTPGTPNSSQPSESADSGGENSQDNRSNVSSEESTDASSPTPAHPSSYEGTSASAPPKDKPRAQQTFSVDAGDDRTIAAGSQIIFEADAQPESDFTTYEWYFGDGTQKEGKRVWYIYPHPGQYVVTVEAHDGDDSARDRIQVTAYEADLTISAVESRPDGYIELTNNTNRDIDLSGWHLQGNDNFFTFPENTMLLAGQSIAYPHRTTDLAVATKAAVKLLYPNGKVALENIQQTRKSTTSANITYADARTEVETQRSEQNTPSSETTSSRKTSPSNVGTQTDSTISAQAAAVQNTNTSLFGWIAGLMAVLLLAVVTVLSIASSKENEGKGTKDDDIENLAAEFDVISNENK
jgi:hypothetical protein